MAQASTGRTATSAAVVAGSLAVTTVALRSHLPGATPAVPDRTPDDPVAAAVVIGLLLAAVAVVAVAVVLRIRNPVSAPAAVAGRLDWMRMERRGPTRRTLVIAFGVILVGVALAVVLSSVTIGPGPDAAPPADPPTSTGPTAARPDRPAADAGPDAEDVPAQRDWNLLGYFYVATAAFLVVLVAGSVAVARRRPRPSASNPPPMPDADSDAAAVAESESLVRAAEVGLAAVEDLTRDPRSSIIACYAAMERELARVPGASPRDFDTASEVLARAVELRALQPDSATELVDLFDEARFSPHVMTETHREAAVDVLRHVLDELGSMA